MGDARCGFLSTQKSTKRWAGRTTSAERFQGDPHLHISGETVKRPGNTVTLSVFKERAHTRIQCRIEKFEDQQAVETILKHRDVVPRAAQETVVLLPIDDSSETTSTTAVGETLMTYLFSTSRGGAAQEVDETLAMEGFQRITWDTVKDIQRTAC